MTGQMTASLLLHTFSFPLLYFVFFVALSTEIIFFSRSHVYSLDSLLLKYKFLKNHVLLTCLRVSC